MCASDDRSRAFWKSPLHGRLHAVSRSASTWLRKHASPTPAWVFMNTFQVHASLAKTGGKPACSLVTWDQYDGCREHGCSMPPSLASCHTCQHSMKATACETACLCPRGEDRLQRSTCAALRMLRATAPPPWGRRPAPGYADACSFALHGFFTRSLSPIALQTCAQPFPRCRTAVPRPVVNTADRRRSTLGILSARGWLQRRWVSAAWCSGGHPRRRRCVCPAFTWQAV